MQGFVWVGEGQVHYRWEGTGPALVLLHPATGSSAMLRPVVDQLSAAWAVLAIDLPGYGLSEGAGVSGSTSVSDYAAMVAQTLVNLGVKRATLLGYDLGASVAAEVAAGHPELVQAAVLDQLLQLGTAEREEYLARVCPDFEPTISGAHLIERWSYLRDERCFFPWYQRDREHWLAPDLRHTSEVVASMQAAIVDQLRHGTGYRIGYAAQARYDATKALAEVAAPTWMTNLRGSGAQGVAGASDCVRATDDSVLSALAQARAAVSQIEFTGPVAEQTDRPGRISRAFVETEFGRLHVRRRTEGSARPLVLLHESPGSAEPLEPLMNLLAPKRPVYAFDLLGNGDSARPDQTAYPQFLAPVIDDYAPVLLAGLDALGVGEVDLYGMHTGALVAIEIARLAPDRVHNVILEGLPMYSPEKNAAVLGNFFVDLRPQWDGSHLLAAWSSQRDAGVWYPWYLRTPEAAARFAEQGVVDPHTTQAKVSLLLGSGETYSLSYRAAFKYDARARLPELTARTLVCAMVSDRLHEFCDEAATLAAIASSATLPEELADKASRFEEFLEGDPS